MATQYPAEFPQPLLDGFAATVAMGVIRSDMASHQAQRRVYRTMPHSFTLTFVMSVEQWGSWYRWVSANGFSWFEMELPALYAGRLGALVSAAPIRFTSDVAAANVSASHVRVSVSAEISPSAIGAWLEAV